MRLRIGALLLVQGILTAACSRSDSSRFTLQHNKVERVEGCHIILDIWNPDHETPYAGVRFVCGAPESAQHQEAWWGDKPQPLAFDMSLGECLLLGERFYCLEKVEPEGVTFKATYQWANRHHDRIKPLP